MDESPQLTELLTRMQRLEQQIGSLTANMASLAQAYNSAVQEIYFSQVAYLGDHRALTHLRSGQKIFVDTRSVDIGTHLMLGGMWEPNYATAFQNLLRPGDKVLDIGANHGVYSLLAAARIAPGGHVWAFEPSRDFYELVRASVSVNGLDGVITVENLAAADHTFETTLLADVHWSGGSHLSGANEPHHGDAMPGNMTSQRVRCVPLDDHFSDPAIAIDMIKMDIEGAEGLALKGMEKLIDRSRNLKIMLEFVPAMMARFEYGAPFVREFLESRGFMCWLINASGDLVPTRWESLLSGSGQTIQNIMVSRQGLA